MEYSYHQIIEVVYEELYTVVDIHKTIMIILNKTLRIVHARKIAMKFWIK